VTSIEWTEATWNPIAGCTIVSPGCTHCYAMRQAARIERMIPSLQHYKGLTKPSKAGPVWTGKVALAPERTLLEPLRRRKPTMWFVNSMSDLFHEDVPDDWIDQIFAVMALCPQHTFQVLTKRAERMRDFVSRLGAAHTTLQNPMDAACAAAADAFPHYTGSIAHPGQHNLWPLPNVWLGTSCERQQEADARIPHLLATPAAVRFVSLEPLLGPIELWRYDEEDCALRGAGVVRSGGMTASTPDSPPEGYDDSYPGLDWVIVGGESGKDARPMHPDWARSLRDQCTAAGVAYFFKQWGQFYEIDTREGPDHVDAWLDDMSVHRVDHGARRAYMRRVNRKVTGRLLDGREWNEMPTPFSTAAPATVSVP
jgi:protein gp37